jgi:hypothetical protein
LFAAVVAVGQVPVTVTLWVSELSTNTTCLPPGTPSFARDFSLPSGWYCQLMVRLAESSSAAVTVRRVCWPRSL